MRITLTPQEALHIESNEQAVLNGLVAVAGFQYSEEESLEIITARLIMRKIREARLKEFTVRKSKQKRSPCP